MARTANPDKPKIDALRAEGKLHVQAIKDGHKALKKLSAVNAKLVKFDVAEIAAPDAPVVKAKTPAKVAVKSAAAKAKAEPAAKAKTATKAKAPVKGGKSVTTAPKKRGRPAKTDSDLDFD